MADKIEGYLLVGTNERGEVVVNLDRDRTGHIMFSPNQARSLAGLLLKKAEEAAVVTVVPPVMILASPPTPASPAQPNDAVREALSVQALLSDCLKPEEISGPNREARIRELLHWFLRLKRGNANPKWLRPHAYELAYALATSPALSAPQPAHGKTGDSYTGTGLPPIEVTTEPDGPGKCHACQIEAEIGTEEVPHPIDPRIHTCKPAPSPSAKPAGSREQRDALEWYAEQRNYLPAAPDTSRDSYAHLSGVDGWDTGKPGARARAALPPSPAAAEARTNREVES